MYFHIRLLYNLGWAFEDTKIYLQEGCGLSNKWLRLQLRLCVYHYHLGKENIQTGNDSGLPAVENFRLHVTFNKTLSLDFSNSVLIRRAFRRSLKSDLLKYRMQTLEIIK